MNWISTYLFYEEPLDTFLIRCVKPLVEKLVSKKLIKQYFFIRYWEKGTHVRLRVCLKRKEEKTRVENIIKRHFSQYFKLSPSKRNISSSINTQNEDDKWYPNNSCFFIEYERETERYGGPQSIRTAEKQFELSTKIVFTILTTHKELDKLKYAIQLHLSFAHSIGLSMEEMKCLFKMIYLSWLPLAYETEFGSMNLEKHKDRVVKVFEKLYESQKIELLKFHETIIELLGDKFKFEEEWINIWINGNKKLNTELERLMLAGHYCIPAWLKLDPSLSVSEEKQKLFYIYKSFVHMTNNRLGVSYKDEAYLGYLMYKSIENLAASKTIN